MQSLPAPLAAETSVVSLLPGVLDAARTPFRVRVSGLKNSVAFKLLRQAAQESGLAEMTWGGVRYVARRGETEAQIRRPLTIAAAEARVKELRSQAFEDLAHAEAVRRFKERGGAITSVVAPYAPEAFTELAGGPKTGTLLHARHFALLLVTPRLYASLPPGAQLFHHDGREHVKGADPRPGARGSYLDAGVPVATRSRSKVPPLARLVSAEAQFAWRVWHAPPKGPRPEHDYLLQALAEVRDVGDVRTFATELMASPESLFRHPEALHEIAAVARDADARAEWEAIAQRQPKSTPVVLPALSDGTLLLDVVTSIESPVPLARVVEQAFEASRAHRVAVEVRFRSRTWFIRPDYSLREAHAASNAAMDLGSRAS